MQRSVPGREREGDATQNAASNGRISSTVIYCKLAPRNRACRKTPCPESASPSSTAVVRASMTWSIASATSVMQAIDKDKYDVLPVYLTPAGRWLPGVEPVQLTAGAHPVAATVALFSSDPQQPGLLPLSNAPAVQPEQAQAVDVVFSAAARHLWRGRHRARAVGTRQRALRRVGGAGVGRRHGQGRHEDALRRCRSARGCRTCLSDAASGSSGRRLSKIACYKCCGCRCSSSRRIWGQAWEFPR